VYGREPQALDRGHEALAGMAGPLEAQLPFMPDPAIDPEGVADWLGEYENGWTLAIRDENQLWLARPDRAFLLLPLPDGTFLAANGDAAGALIGFAAEGDQTVLTLTAGEVVMQLNKVGQADRPGAVGGSMRGRLQACRWRTKPTKGAQSCSSPCSGLPRPQRDAWSIPRSGGQSFHRTRTRAKRTWSR